EELHDAFARLGVEVAGRLVAEEEQRLDDQGARDGGALHLPARELRRPAVHLVLEADVPKDVEAALAPDGPRHPGIHERQLDVLEDVVLRNEIEGLEDEADPPVADARQLGVVDVLDGDAVEAVAAAARAVEAPG